MVFRLCLLMMALALALFIVGLALQKLSFVNFAVMADMLGIDLLLAGFALLFFLGVFYALKVTLRDLIAYFSKTAAVRRKVLFAQSRLRDIEQFSIHVQSQIEYFNALKRARLLKANNDKHVRLLAKALYRQLYAMRATLPRPSYRELQKAIRIYRRRCDGEALLALQKQLGVQE